GGPVRRRTRSGQGDVLLVELLDVDVLEGHHAHGAHEAVRAVDVPHPDVREPQFVEDLASPGADLQVHLVGEVETALGLDHVGEQADHVARFAEQLEFEIGLVVLEFPGAPRRSFPSCADHWSSHSTPAGTRAAVAAGVPRAERGGGATAGAGGAWAAREPSRQLRRWCAWTPRSSIAARCAAEPYPLLAAQQEWGASASSSTMWASRATFARMLAAATLAQSRSAATCRCTSGAGRSAADSAGERTWTSPSSTIASATTWGPSASRARRAARVSAGMIPISSISAGPDQPTAPACTVSRMGVTSASRLRAVSALESLMPSGSG